MLHPQLAADTQPIGTLPICHVLLNAQFSQFPWVILVPNRTGCRDLTDLPEADYLPVMGEVRAVHNALKMFTKAEKMNVAAIGNMVPQLHIHLIARFQADDCWPKPVWGHSLPQPYDDTGFTKAKQLYEFFKSQGLDLTAPTR